MEMAAFLEGARVSVVYYGICFCRYLIVDEVYILQFNHLYLIESGEKDLFGQFD